MVLSMPDFDQKREGLLLGSFVADALSLGVHWIYDTEIIANKFGTVDAYHAPGADSYHPHKVAGDQGHVGDQALCLYEFVKGSNGWDKAAFMQQWLQIWPNYNDYFDHATKTVLANIKNGAAITEAASDSSACFSAHHLAPKRFRRNGNPALATLLYSTSAKRSAFEFSMTS